MAQQSNSSQGLVALAVARLMLGFVFLWAFVDKLWGFGFATPAAKAWVNGGSPTSGFLGSVGGPFEGFFTSLAGQAWVDWLFMLGLLGIGLALLLGVGVRIAAVTGSVLLVLMWAASLPLDNNPFVDDHLVYAVVLVVLALQDTQSWSVQPMMKSLLDKNPWLR